MHFTRTPRFKRLVLYGSIVVTLLSRAGLCADRSSRKYLQSVRTFADRVMADGRDDYGKTKTPLFVDGLHVKTLEPVRWKCRGEIWVPCNFASQQPLLRTLEGLTTLTGEGTYRKAAEDATRHALQHLRTPNGLLYWGGHLAWDLEEDKPVGQYADVHELKGHQPYYRLMWRVDSSRTKQLVEMVWAAHILDWSLLDYNRHGSVRRDYRPQWDHAFAEDVEVPFPAKGGNLSFVNVTPPLLHSAVALAVLDRNPQVLKWARRLIERWQQGRHPETGLCGGQLSYREHDRAQDALGNVHPEINEAKIVASYHQTCRYHHLPLAQMQAAVTLLEAGGEYARVGRDFVRWASEDLKAYARHCYDRKQEQFTAVMIDGTPLRWREARTGYYTPGSFAPRKPDGFLLWGYALAYRLTKDAEHLEIARRMAHAIDAERNDWRAVYALLELHEATGDETFLDRACRVADNLLEMQTPTDLFPRSGREYARTGDDIPLALLHLAAAIDGKSKSMPRPMFDRRFFHCEYHGPLQEHQQKRADARTYDHLVFYGSD